MSFAPPALMSVIAALAVDDIGVAIEGDHVVALAADDDFRCWPACRSRVWALVAEVVVTVASAVVRTGHRYRHLAPPV